MSFPCVRTLSHKFLTRYSPTPFCRFRFLLRLVAALCGVVSGVRADTTGPQVVKIENRGLLFTDNPAGVSGTDAGYSIAMGRQSLWLFGDVFLLQPNAPSRRYVGGVSNCALVTPKGEGTEPLRHYTFLTNPKTGLARQVLPNLPGEGNDIRLWPFGGWYDAGQKRVYLYYGRIQTTGGGGPFAFRQEGLGLAYADTADIANLEFHRIKDAQGSELWWTGADGAPYFGSAVVCNAPDDYLYIVGIQEREKHKIGKLARVPRAKIADSTAYEVYAGSTPAGPRWERDIRQAADIEGLADFPSELSVAYNPYLGGYLAVYSEGISEKMRLSLAPNPWGPYHTLGEIGTPHQAFAQAFCYAGKEHPELEEEHGRILIITYVDNQRYWLQCLRVTLQRGKREEGRGKREMPEQDGVAEIQGHPDADK